MWWPKLCYERRDRAPYKRVWRMATNASHLKALFSTVLLHNILIFFMLSISSLMRCQIFADFHRHCATREGSRGRYFWSKKGIGWTVWFKCYTSHPANTFHMRTATISGLPLTTRTSAKLLIKFLSELVFGVHFFLCPSSDRATCIASRLLSHYQYHLRFISVNPGSIPLTSHPPLVRISRTGWNMPWILDFRVYQTARLCNIGRVTAIVSKFQPSTKLPYAV